MVAIYDGNVNVTSLGKLYFAGKTVSFGKKG
jgi:hypothetical protein